MATIVYRVRGQRNAAPKTYAQDLGWRAEWDDGALTHSGYFYYMGMRWKGWVKQEDNGRLHFYIQRPPINLIRNTEYGGCFHPLNDGWWRIAFKPHAIPPNLDSGIAAVHHVLIEAFK